MSSTRSKSKKNEPVKKVTHHKYCDTKVFLIDGELVGENSENVEIILLRNPCTEKPSRYLIARHLDKFYEILSFSEEPRSWFINDMTCTNGSLYMTAIFDPLFFAIYYLRKNCMERAIPLDQAVVDDNFSHTNFLLDILKDEQLAMIADQKGDKQLKAFKYNEEKALKWLSLKCKRLADALKEKQFYVGAKSANFVKVDKFEDGSRQVYSELLTYSFGIVSEYIQQGLSEKLGKRLNIEQPNPITVGKRKSLGELVEQTALKRLKSEENVLMLECVTTITAVKEKKISAKEKQMAKAASGTKSISSFFAKK